jgi:hypothetical protein
MPEGIKRFIEGVRRGSESMADLMATHLATPEAYADYMSAHMMDGILRPNPQWETVLRGMRDDPKFGEPVENMLDHFYSMADVRRDLGIQTVEPNKGPEQ